MTAVIQIRKPRIDTGHFHFGRQASKSSDDRFTPYRFDPANYISTFLKWTPWHGQLDIMTAYTTALQQQHERDDWEQGRVQLDDLQYWQPGQTIRNRIRIEAGHTVGKTKGLAGLVSHFFDCFPPAIVYCFAPSDDQINDLLFKEIRTDREGKGLPGTVLLEPRINYKSNHFVKGKATNNSNDTGVERAQGQHGKYLMFVLDEAEGIPDFVWNAVDSMTSGGISIVLMAANPRTRTSRFYKAKVEPNVVSFRISCLDHPNVIENREIVPGAVRRDYVVSMLKHCEVVPAHDPDYHTFELPWQPGIIYKPGPEYLFRVLGIAPANLSDNTFCPTGRYEAACNRQPISDDKSRARIGVDCARYGNDNGTIYTRFAGAIEKRHDISKQDSYEYYRLVREECLRLHGLGVKDIQVRIDGGGGYGSTPIDLLRRDFALRALFYSFAVIEVLNNADPYDITQYDNLVTEMYACTGELLKRYAIVGGTDKLMIDLCERTFEYGNNQGYEVKRLVSKEKFRKPFKRSPDDGDGCVLAGAPDYCFVPKEQKSVDYTPVQIGRGW